MSLSYILIELKGLMFVLDMAVKKKNNERLMSICIQHLC